MPAAEARTPYAGELDFELRRAADALAVWFSADMPGARPLSNGPGQPRTHWGTLLFPITGGRDARAGDRLHVGFHNVPAGAYGSHHIWAVRLGDAELEVHDTRLNRNAGYEPPWRVYQPQGDVSYG
jgi:hypothetical protein